MAKRTKKEILELINKLENDSNKEEILGLMEDVTDSFDTTGNTEWEKEKENLIKDYEGKIKAKDDEWREKYKSRFLENNDTTTKNEQNENRDEEINEEDGDDFKFDDMFRLKEGK